MKIVTLFFRVRVMSKLTHVFTGDKVGVDINCTNFVSHPPSMEFVMIQMNVPDYYATIDEETITCTKQVRPNCAFVPIVTLFRLLNMPTRIFSKRDTLV
jgi:hypothetical protein